MTRAILAALFFAAPAFAADDPILADLDKAKAAHAKELRILRQNLLDDIDKIIRQTNDMGGGIDYMLRERKGFAESGVTPILPKLKGASDNYLEAKNAADGTLEAAYATAVDKSIKAGMLLQGSNLKVELKAMRDARQGVRNPPVLPPVAGPKDTPDERPNQRLGGAAKPGEERVFEIAKGVKMTFCWIPAGEAQLGSTKAQQNAVAKIVYDGERPKPLEAESEEARGKFTTKGFWLGKYEVTQDTWERLMGSNPSKFRGDKLPVEMVSWEDCQDFIRRCKVDGLTPKLPHENEWEYACQGGKGNKQAFYWGDALNGDKANTAGDYPFGTAIKGECQKKTSTVGSYEKVAPHPWGLCDMIGNVWEWCDNAPSASSSDKVLRGGCWDGTGKCSRTAIREWSETKAQTQFTGFRLALVSSLKIEGDAPKGRDTADERPTQRLGGGAKPGEEREIEIARGVKMQFCWVPAGEAQLGSPKDERDYANKTFNSGEPPSYVDAEAEAARGKFRTKGFWLGKYEVTQREWEGVMGNNPSHFRGLRLPVENVSWNDCQGFVKNCRVDNLIPRLPHEDEWEYACRGGKGNNLAFYWGNELNGDKANCVGNKPYGKAANGDFLQRTTLVGSYEKVAPHPWGLCDMHGNVWEWSDNLYSSSGLEKSLRGGGWDSITGLCRSAWRSRALPSVKNLNLGFRLVLASELAPPLKDIERGTPKAGLPRDPADTNPKSTRQEKDETVEQAVARAKFNYTSAVKAASATMLEMLDTAKSNVVATKKLTDAAKLAYLDALAKDRAAFEKDGTHPRHPALQLAAKKYDDAISKAREEFSKAVNEAGKVYVDRKDTANYEALLREKQRFLASPTATK